VSKNQSLSSTSGSRNRAVCPHRLEPALGIAEVVA
jgi:hypothetical protein